MVLTLLLIVYYYIKKKENFVSYKKNIIQLTPEVHKPATISVGCKNGGYYRFAQILSKIYPLELDNHDGSSYKNIDNLIKNKTEFAICQVDTAVSALLGKYPFNTPNNDLRYVCSLYPETVTLIASYRSRIKSWKELKNKTVCVGKKSYASYYNFITLCIIAGINPSEVNIIEQNIFDENIIRKFSSGEIDALYITTPHPKQKLYRLYTQVRYVIVGIFFSNNNSPS